MKKIVILVIILALILSGCGAKEEPVAEITPSEEAATSQQASEPTTAAEPEAGASTEPASEPVTEEEPGAAVGEDMQAYSGFLDGEEPCFLAKDALGEGSKGSSYTLRELIEASCAYFETEGLSFFLESANSAYIDCGGDGVKELALQILLKPTEDTEYYDLVQLYILKYMDGQLQLVGSDWGYYRSWVSMNPYGVMNYSGSSSASSYFVSTSFVDAEGQERFLFSTDVQMGLAEPAVDYYNIADSIRPENYPSIEMSDSDTEYYSTDAYSFEEYKDGDDYDAYLASRFFRFTDAEGNDAEPSEELKSTYEEIGLKWYDTKTINEMLAQRIETMGLTIDMYRDRNEPQWEAVF